MTEHVARIAWRVGASGFAPGRFSRVHEWAFDGGLTVQASASPAVIPAPYSDPAAIDPEEAFVAAIASCHMMSFLYLANKQALEVVAYSDDARGQLGKRNDRRRAIVLVELNPIIEWAPGHAPSRDAVAALHDEAHATCYIANSVSCEIVINGASEPG